MEQVVLRFMPKPIDEYINTSGLKLSTKYKLQCTIHSLPPSGGQALVLVVDNNRMQRVNRVDSTF